MPRWYAYAVSAAVLAAVLSPLAREPQEDGYPLSTYPMFSRNLRDPTMDITRAVAVTRRGETRPVPPELVANAEVLQALVTIRAAVRAGPRQAMQLCERIADRLARAQKLAGAREVRLVTQRIDAVAYVSGDHRTEGGRVHARCPVDAP